MKKYDHKKIEAKWQKYWQAKKTFLAKDFSKKEKKFVLVEFPYPSGEGLHMGHLRPYVAADVYSRFNRMNGKEVIFPMGWDAFGLPAENFAIKKGVHPSVSTKKNVANAKRQIQSWGLSFDWSREVNTTDPNYYKWTQWIFLQLYKAGLAYEATGLINWCPKDKTGLANEEVIDGKCERCGSIVEKKELRQWYLKITAYAEKLLEGLKNLPKWPEPVKLQQENWIGKSLGAEISFPLDIPATGESTPNYLLIHGYTGSAAKNFIPWLKKELENRGFKVQAPELPNPSDPKEEEQVNYILENCEINDKTIIVGHSLGAVVAMKVLLKKDQAVAGLVLVAPTVDPTFPGADPKPFWKHFTWNLDYEKLTNLAGFRLALSDLTEEKRIPYLEVLSKKLRAGLIAGQAQQKHFAAEKEPLILESLLPGLKVFTTRPDTILGATYMVLAPEHPWVVLALDNKHNVLENKEEVRAYVEIAKNKTDIQRSALDKEKTGVELKGVKAINPATGEKIPIWVADYVLMGYGTGAIMAVPEHDERDRQFAEKYKLPIVDKPLIAMPEAIQKFGQAKVQYKLRDWVFSRQRYWGEPIPIIHCPKCSIVPVPVKDLPVKLPPVKKYQPTGTGESPLAAITKWVNVKCPDCKSPAKRETNTMPQWAGSSWYWLRYTDPKNKKEFASITKQKYWTPVDVYFGGMEHTTLHLLYSRFWNLFLYDQKLVTSREPYILRKPHGLILGPDGEKMSKSRGNVVNPDAIVKSDGADTLRMYELFLGPHEASVSWNEHGHVGVRRFLDRVWYWVGETKDSGLKIKDSDKSQRALHKLIKKITEDIENFSFNTSISAFMEFHNQVKDEPVSLASLKIFLTLLYPFAPHLAEELHQLLGGKKSLQLETWPAFDEALTIDNTVEIVVQVNGKVKGRVNVPRDTKEEELKKVVLSDVAKDIDGGTIKRTIFVPNRLINFVV